MFSNREKSRCHSLFLFRCETPSSSDQATANAASMLISLASATLTVASCFSSYSGSPSSSSLQQLLLGFVLNKTELLPPFSKRTLLGPVIAE